MRSVAIAGVGLIGGSFGLALRRAGFHGTITGISRPETIEAAVALGAVDAATTLEQAAAESDVLFLAQPVGVIIETLRRLAPMARPDCLITDAGSTKAAIISAAREIPLFLGGHPMAGKETSGVSSAAADLFEGRPWVICSRSESDRSHPRAAEYLSWISRCGATLIHLEADEHDRTVAFTSHLPQLASTALGAALAAQVADAEKLFISGSGVRDMTRLAMSSWEVWRDILATNSSHIQHALNVYIDKLTFLRDNTGAQSIADDFRSAADVAGSLRQPRQRISEEG
ncbi:MAG TPA: prephenate dehydrogenase/arogenate dehydrogenase family protein [Bryobacteraceae bacterium]|nr:prephenate dehydrogenase/arogenate dehydrogenase family protein [Bryobacteraceae bacterium]